LTITPKAQVAKEKNIDKLEIKKILHIKKTISQQSWWYTSIIPALRRQKQGDGEFNASLFKKKKKTLSTV
jgi:hypothetical protein